MCTVTCLIKPNDIILTSNRDIPKERVHSEPPKIYKINSKDFFHLIKITLCQIPHVYKYKDFINLANHRVISSVGLEHYLDRVGVGSSNLPSPTFKEQ